MEMTVVVLNALSFLCFTLTLLLIILKTERMGLPLDTKIMLSAACCVLVFVNFSNVLEHLGITAELDYYEDYAELMVPLFFMGALNSFRLHGEIAQRRLNERQLDTMLKDRNELLKEVHHRVKNNLQVVLSIISLRRRQRDVDAKADQILMATESRIFSMAAVHEVIYRHEHSRSIPVESFTRAIVTAIARSVPSGRSGAVRATIEVAPDVSLRLEKAVSFGLLVNELISNSFRHSFPGDLKGEVHLTLSEANGQATLQVRDDGESVDGHVDADGEGPLSSTLIANLITQLEGTAEVTAERGNSVLVRFPS